MWFYHSEAKEVETITHLESGVQVMRSGNEVWWRGNETALPIEQDEMKLATCKDAGAAKGKFWEVCSALAQRGELAGHPEQG